MGNGCGVPLLVKELLANEVLAGVMWDIPLYAVNMFYYHWLIRKLLQPIAVQNIARLEEIDRIG